MSTVINPLDQFSGFMERALLNVYEDVNCENYPPTLGELASCLPIHFKQALGWEIIISEQFGAVGAEDKEDFVEKLENGEYDRFVPDGEFLRMLLDAHHLSYLDRVTIGYEFRNNCVVEVW